MASFIANQDSYFGPCRNLLASDAALLRYLYVRLTAEYSQVSYGRLIVFPRVKLVRKGFVQSLPLQEGRRCSVRDQYYSLKNQGP